MLQTYPVLSNTFWKVLTVYLERLRSDIVVERFASQSPADLLIAPAWGLKNHEFTEWVKRSLRQRNTYQGRLYVSR